MIDLVGCGEGLGSDNASAYCATHPDAATVSALTISVDPGAASGVAQSAGACTSLSCTVEYDAGGCLQWGGEMTATSNATCTVTFNYVDGAAARVVLSTGNVCDHPAPRSAAVHSNSIDET